MRKLTEEEKPVYVCIYCNKSFKTKYRRTKKNISKFCTMECRDNNRIKVNSERLRKCLTCNKEKPNKEFGMGKTKKRYLKRCDKCRENNPVNRNKKYKDKYGYGYDVYKKGLTPETFLHDLIKISKYRAKDKNKEHSINDTDIMIIYNKQNGKCAITGTPLTFIVGQNKVPTNMSLDRINSEIGYTVDNTQIVCYIVNIMKNKMSIDDLKFWCSKILNPEK